jgi:hypothetical protein
VSGQNAGIVAVATVTSLPQYISDTQKEITLYPGPPPKFQGEQLRVMLHINKPLSRRITRTELLNHPVLRDLSIIKMPQGTNFKVSDEQAEHLASLASEG